MFKISFDNLVLKNPLRKICDDIRSLTTKPKLIHQ